MVTLYKSEGRLYVSFFPSNFQPFCFKIVCLCVYVHACVHVLCVFACTHTTHAHTHAPTMVPCVDQRTIYWSYLSLSPLYCFQGLNSGDRVGIFTG